MNVSTFDIKQRYAQLTKGSTVFSYLGSLSSADLNTVLKSIELLLTANYSSKGLQKKLFNLLIEITQNLYNYLKSPVLEDRNEVFIVVLECENTHKIITGNFLLTREIASIRSRIEMVNALNNEELKELYRGILDVGIPSHGGGAGLGLIDLARKSGRKLSYSFEEIDDKFSFFTLEVTFSNS
ncbi:SiaB family protein kinase [Fulvivirga sp. 29W222]|uniref:SiaB family protein kinase n=1 Tax=Fulvivirga marina TaxID=2494733 RepID=A0A937G7U6_9BACT|nr:SiaB family protein kinase [Fulvivirga marina]MBL6450011.1 SiaB family protein kinase [Fulvivirga marina]